jgi:hypothetical protein
MLRGTSVRYKLPGRLQSPRARARKRQPVRHVAAEDRTLAELPRWHRRSILRRAAQAQSGRWVWP